MNFKSVRSALLSKTESLLDMPEGILRDEANIILYGTSLVEIDNFKGLIDFSDSSVRINTVSGIVRIDGVSLFISSMTDETLSLKGNVKNICFE